MGWVLTVVNPSFVVVVSYEKLRKEPPKKVSNLRVGVGFEPWQKVIQKQSQSVTDMSGNIS